MKLDLGRRWLRAVPRAAALLTIAAAATMTVSAALGTLPARALHSSGPAQRPAGQARLAASRGIWPGTPAAAGATRKPSGAHNRARTPVTKPWSTAPKAPGLPRPRAGASQSRLFFGPAGANVAAVVRDLAAGRSPASLGLSTTTPAVRAGVNAQPDAGSTAVTPGSVMDQPRYTVDSSLFTGAPPPVVLKPGDCRAVGGAYDLDRFDACEIYTVFYYSSTCFDTCTTADLGFRDTLVAEGSNVDRAMDFKHYLDDFSWVNGAELTEIQINMSCAVIGVGECHSTSPVEGTALDWNDAISTGKPQATFSMGSDPAQADPASAEAITWAQANLSFTFENATTTTTQAFPFNFRFDTASYLTQPNNTGGGVFANAIPTLTFDRGDTQITQNASHIYDALYNPGYTAPVWAAGSKSIPGRGQNAGDFLTRATAAVKQQNYNAGCGSASALAAINPPNYGLGASQDCDEFPFQSTNQGVAATIGTATPQFSLRYIDSADNQALGNRVGNFYNYEHILYGDTFAVDAYGTPPNSAPFPVVDVPAGGTFRSTWTAAGGSGGALGAPNYYVSYLPTGQFQTFTGGLVAWSPGNGTYPVTGAIATDYFSDGGPGASAMGYPTGNPYAVGAGTAQNFQNGTIESSAAGTFRVMNDLLSYYLSHGGPAGYLGFPIDDAFAITGGLQQDFQQGSISDIGGTIGESHWVTGHAAHAGNDYPWETIGQFDHSNEGTDPWAEYYGQCDSFAAWKVYENLAGSPSMPPVVPDPGWVPSASPGVSPVNQNTWGNADNWGNMAPKFGYSVDNVPAPGAIVWWRNAVTDPQNPGLAPDPAHGIGEFGHVGYVTDVYPDGSITIESYNLRLNGEYSTLHMAFGQSAVDTSFHQGAFTVPWPDGFIHIGDGPASGASSPPEPVTGTVAWGYAARGANLQVIGPGSQSSQFSTGNVWYSRAAHGELGDELYTHANGPTAVSTAKWAPAGLAADACYRVDAFVPDNYSDDPVTVYTMTDATGTSYAAVNENEQTNDWSELGVYKTNSSGGGLTVMVDDRGNTGLYVAADAVRFWRQSSCNGEGDVSPIMRPASYFPSQSSWAQDSGHGFFGTMYYSTTTGTSTAAKNAMWTPSRLVPNACYDVSVYVPDNYSDNAAASYWTNDAYYGPFFEQVDENSYTNQFAGIGTFEANSDGTLPLELFNSGGANLFVAADAAAFVLNPNCQTQNGGTSTFGQPLSGSIIGPGSGSANFSTTGDWSYYLGFGWANHQLYSADNAGATATWTFTGTPGTCYDVDAYIPIEGYADNTSAGYLVSSNVVGGLAVIDQSQANGWTNLSRLAAGSDGKITVQLTDNGDSGGYTAADEIRFTPASCP